MWLTDSIRQWKDEILPPLLNQTYRQRHARGVFQHSFPLIGFLTTIYVGVGASTTSRFGCL